MHEQAVNEAATVWTALEDAELGRCAHERSNPASSSIRTLLIWLNMAQYPRHSATVAWGPYLVGAGLDRASNRRLNLNHQTSMLCVIYGPTAIALI